MKTALHVSAWVWLLFSTPVQGIARDGLFAQVDDRLHNDDVSLIQDAATAASFAMLWHCFEMALQNRYGKDMDESDKGGRLSLNARIRAAAGEKLRSMPGHARFLADEIAKLGSSSPQRRQEYFRCLGQLGGKEVVQQIGRFMYEEFIVDLSPQRQLMAFRTSSTVTNGIPSIACGTEEALMTPVSNDRMAALAMHYALGADSPCASMFPGATWVPASAPVIERWWRSAASLPYRQKLPGVELPENVRNPPSAAQVEARRRETEAQFDAISPEAGGEQLSMWVNVTGLMTVLALVVWLVVHKRARPLPLNSSRSVLE